MGPEGRPGHLEQNNNRYTAVLTVRGKEERISGTFREIQMLNVIDSARKNGERVSAKDLRDLDGSQFNQDLSLLRKNLENHGVAVVSSGKRGTREYSLEEIPQQPTENPSVVSDPAKTAFSPKVAIDVESANRPSVQEPVVMPTVPQEPPIEGTLVDFSPESPLKLQENNNNPLILPDGKIAPKLRDRQREFLKLLITAKNEGRDFSEQDLRIMYPDIHTPLYAWKKLSKTAVFVRPRIRDLGWNIEFKISKDGTKKTYELNHPVEPSGSNPIPIIFPDGTEGPKTWGRIRKILETLIEAYKEGRIFSKKEIWQKVCPEIPFKDANYKISKAIMDNLKSILLDTQWRIEAVRISQNEHVTYALMKKVEVSENPISDKEIPVSANGSKPIEDSAPAKEPAVTPTMLKELPREVTVVDSSPNSLHIDLTSPGSGQYPASQGESLQGLRGQIELAKPIEPSRSNPIPVILPDGSKGSRTWGRTRKVVEALIKANKQGVIFSKKEIWQKACAEISFKEAGPIISGAANNLRYTGVGWIIETVQTPKGEPVTYALRKKGAHRLEYIPESIQRAATEEKPLPHPLPAADTKGSKYADLPPYEPVRAPKPEQKPIINNGLPPTADIFRKISSSDGHNGKRGATVLFEGEREEEIIDSIKEASRIILSQTLAGKLERIKGATPRSLIESALPIGASFDILFKIDSQEEFNQRFIEAIMSQWRRLLSDNHTLLSIKEIEDRQKLLDLRILGFTMEKMEIIIRILFKTKPPILASTKDK